MRIGLLHGYELTGSGSNEYCRYLSRALASAGHEVHLWCREPDPAGIAHATAAIAWDADGAPHEIFDRAGSEDGSCTIHQMPHASVRPVYLTDKQRDGCVKSFLELSDAELDEYHELTVRVVRAGVAAYPIDVMHANHLIWQPRVAQEVGVPYVVFPHGSAIEYVVRHDARYLEAARDGLRGALGIVSGNREVLERVFDLFPEDRAHLEGKARVAGVGVDTDLFVPVTRSERRASIARLTAPEAAPARGKTAEQRAELRLRLAERDFGAMSVFRNSYDQASPDADAVERLASLDHEGAKLLLFVGSLTAGKGLQDLLCALPDVFEDVPSAQLIVVGNGAFREVLEGLVHAIDLGDERLWTFIRENGFGLDSGELQGPFETLPELVPTFPGFGERVLFLGRLDHARLQHVFPCADLAVFPSVVPEAYPLVLMEALANGVVPVVSDFSGFRDGLDELALRLGDSLVDKMRLPVGDDRVSAITSRLTQLLRTTVGNEQKRRLREIAVESYDWRVRARELTDVLQDLLEVTPVERA